MFSFPVNEFEGRKRDDEFNANESNCNTDAAQMKRFLWPSQRKYKTIEGLRGVSKERNFC